MFDGFALWFTGLSGAGKSTLSRAVGDELAARGLRVEILDGDEVRTNLSRDLGYSREDRDTNIRRIGFVAKLLARNGVVAISAAISPYEGTRDEVRSRFPAGRFVEVYAECPLDELIRRDPKGLYKRALDGELQHFTGIDDPYEPPGQPEVVVHTGREPVEVSCARILRTLELMRLIPEAGPGRADEDERIRARLAAAGRR